MKGSYIMGKINVIKIQSEVIKALIKNSYVGFCECEDGVWLTLDSCCAYLIPEPEFYIDMKTRKPMTTLGQIRDKFVFAEKSIPTGEMKQLERFNVMKLKTADGKEKWIQEKYFKLCDSWSYYKNIFYGCNNGIPVVMCMEVRLKNE